MPLRRGHLVLGEDFNHLSLHSWVGSGEKGPGHKATTTSCRQLSGARKRPWKRAPDRETCASRAGERPEPPDGEKDSAWLAGGGLRSTGRAASPRVVGFEVSPRVHA